MRADQEGQGSGKRGEICLTCFYKTSPNDAPHPQVQTFACPRTHSHRLTVMCIQKAFGDVLIFSQILEVNVGLVLRFQIQEMLKEGRKRARLKSEK